MPSQLELLKASEKRVLEKYGPDEPYLQDLRAQIAMHERIRDRKYAENPVDNYTVSIMNRSSEPKAPK